MKITYLCLICVLVLLFGCTVPENSPSDRDTGELEDTSNVSDIEQGIESEQPSTQGNESIGEGNLKEKMADVKLMKGGFETSEIKIGVVSRITIINEDRVMHKLNGGDLFREQFNTYLTSIYGSQDALERNKLKVAFLEAGEYEIKDLTSNSVLKVIVG